MCKVINPAPFPLKQALKMVFATSTLAILFLLTALLGNGFSAKVFLYAAVACVAYNLPWQLISQYFHMKYEQTFLNSYLLIYQTVHGLSLTIEFFAIGYIYIYLIGDENIIFFVCFMYAAVLIIFYTYQIFHFLKRQKNTIPVYYKSQFNGIIFIDYNKLSKAEHKKDTAKWGIPARITLFYLSLVTPGSVIFGAHTGSIALSSCVISFGVFLSVATYRAAYILLVITPEVKKNTGLDIYSDYHSILTPALKNKLLFEYYK